MKSEKPKANFDACDKFFKTIVVSHILASAMHFLGMASFDDLSRSSVLPADVWLMDKEQTKSLLKSVDFNYGSSSISTSGDNNDDYIYQYAQQLVSLGCFYLEYDDAVKEGDGERVLRCWKHLQPIFVNSGRKKYSIKALLLLCQHEYLLPS